MYSNTRGIYDRDKIKVKISSLVANIIENDCFVFGFIKNDNTQNKNAVMNKLISTLVAS